MSSTDRIVIAVVARPHGLRGAVRVKVYNPDTEMLAPGADVGVGAPGGAVKVLRVAQAQPAKDTWIVQFRGVDTVEAAEALRGAELSVTRADLPPPGEGEYYHVDLVGCAVRDAAGADVGVVREVVHYPSVDALVVPTEKGDLEIPVVDAIVTAVDLEARTITVDRDALGDL